MNKIALEVDFKTIKKAINRLNCKDKIRIIEELEKETKPARWDSLIERIRQRKSRQPITDKEIARICEDVRQKRYGNT